MTKVLFPVSRVVDCFHRGVFPLGWEVISQMRFLRVDQPLLRDGSKRTRLLIRSTLDGGGNSPASSGSGRTRLFRAIEVVRLKLDVRIKELRKNLPMKVLFFLVGFYCATAFATVIGQTGDWDILSAGLAVVVVEGIGALMYRASIPFLDKMKNLITMFNYWKAGLTLGLFLDSFKIVPNRQSVSRSKDGKMCSISKYGTRSSVQTLQTEAISLESFPGRTAGISCQTTELKFCLQAIEQPDELYVVRRQKLVTQTQWPSESSNNAQVFLQHSSQGKYSLSL